MSRPTTQRNTWRRLKRNTGAVFGMVIILLSALTGIFAYFISPDKSPDANRMILEIGGKKPGFTQLFLKIPKEEMNAEKDPSFFVQLLYGKKDAYQYLPIIDYRIAKDSLIVEQYIDEGVSETIVFRLPQAAAAKPGSVNSPAGQADTRSNNSSGARAGSRPDTTESFSAASQSSSVIPADSQPANASAVEEDSTPGRSSSPPKANVQQSDPISHTAALAPFKVEKIKFILGTDKYGRDILSRLLIGVRVSLAVGLVTVILSIVIGVFFGAVAGYFGGKVDDVIAWLINVIWSIPTLLLVFAITLMLGKGFWQVFIAIGLTTWVNVARIIRGQVMSIKEMEYIEAARALGFSSARIIVRHILPNVIGPVIVVAASNFASAIVIEAGLSFLGIGVQPPQPSWGLMIRENYNLIITNNAMPALAPGFAIMLLVLAFNLLGNGLRDALQVRE
ncbi:MAG: ABC transporter permease [Chitinophagaceae bacterium]|nr:ABC transporter permease [Chitinophagaceae bacterium]